LKAKEEALDQQKRDLEAKETDVNSQREAIEKEQGECETRASELKAKFKVRITHSIVFECWYIKYYLLAS